jgi:hypothetical protein
VSNNATPERGKDPSIAYPLKQREADAESHILAMAAVGIHHMERTISWRVAQTYGVPHLVDHLKALKSKFRNELSFSGEGK